MEPPNLPPPGATRPPPLPIPSAIPLASVLAAHELRCPMCGYNLRGLTEPRCPECGYRFEWRDLLDADRRVHPYLFEHHPERDAWSFYRTATGLLRPSKFWSSLRPTQPSRPGRLVGYWVIAMAVTLLGAAAPYLAEGIAINVAWNRVRLVPSVRGYSYGKPTAPSRDLFDPQGFSSAWRQIGPGFLAVWILACAWPWLTFLTLMIFRMSMRRAKVFPVHVLRCVLYSGDTFMWAGLAVLVLSVLMSAGATEGIGGRELLHATAVIVLATAVVVVWRLAAAYKLYLQFDHPVATVLAAQCIVALATFIVVLNVVLAVRGDSYG